MESSFISSAGRGKYFSSDSSSFMNRQQFVNCFQPVLSSSFEEGLENCNGDDDVDFPDFPPNLEEGPVVNLDDFLAKQEQVEVVLVPDFFDQKGNSKNNSSGNFGSNSGGNNNNNDNEKIQKSESTTTESEVLIEKLQENHQLEITGEAE